MIPADVDIVSRFDFSAELRALKMELTGRIPIRRSVRCVNEFQRRQLEGSRARIFGVDIETNFVQNGSPADIHENTARSLRELSVQLHSLARRFIFTGERILSVGNGESRNVR